MVMNSAERRIIKLEGDFQLSSLRTELGTDFIYHIIFFNRYGTKHGGLFMNYVDDTKKSYKIYKV